jgi:O-methyltransferase
MSRYLSKLKDTLRPLRVAAGRFVVPSEAPTSTIFYKAAEITSAELVEGDFLEFGVFRGSTFIEAYRTLERAYLARAADRTRIHSPQFRQRVADRWKEMRFFAFDSFCGLPALAGIDQGTRDFEEGKFAASADEFAGNVRASGVDMRKVILVPGWFQDTCVEATRRQHRMRAASIVHIDCDLYESTKTALDFVDPLLVDGTVLVFDDWFSFRGNPQLGEQRAFAEWRATRPDLLVTEYHKEGAWRNSFIVNRASDRAGENLKGPTTCRA